MYEFICFVMNYYFIFFLTLTFGINLDFSRKSYEEDNLKPQDKLTLMFSFKNIGSYKSTNLAVSEKDKQDIQWEEYKVDDSLFAIYE